MTRKTCFRCINKSCSLLLNNILFYVHKQRSLKFGTCILKISTLLPGLHVAFKKFIYVGYNFSLFNFLSEYIGILKFVFETSFINSKESYLITNDKNGPFHQNNSARHLYTFFIFSAICKNNLIISLMLNLEY